MTVPVWVWAAGAAALIAAVAAEIALTRGSLSARRAAGWIGVYVALAAACGLAIGFTAGWVTAGQFYTGYLTEYSLSLDNLIAFTVIMTWFAVPAARQPRVLLFGIGVALVLRSALIVAGATALNRIGWLFYPFGAILIWSAIGLVANPGTRPGRPPQRHTRLTAWLSRRQSHQQSHQQSHLLGRPAGRQVLLLAAAIGLADVAFAVDSIPAVLGITTSAALVVACNVFALMGLRQLYTLTAGLLGRIVYLNAGLGVICAFIGVKLLLRGLVPAWLPVPVVAVVLAATVLASVPAGMRRAMLERRFAVVDTDGNGVWQRADGVLLTRRLCETFGHAADSAAGRVVAAVQLALYDAMLSHMDADGDQEISRDEFVAAVGRGVVDRSGFDAAVGATARTLIRVADADGNGVLDAGEYARLAAVYGAGTDQAERAFVRLDHDRNGVLDAAELGGAISAFFTSRAALGLWAGTTARSV